MRPLDQMTLDAIGFRIEKICKVYNVSEETAMKMFANALMNGAGLEAMFDDFDRQMQNKGYFSL